MARAVSSPSRRAGGNVTAWLFYRQARSPAQTSALARTTSGPAGRAGAPHARGARAGPSAGGYGSAALFSSPWSATHPVGPMAHGLPGGRGRPGHAGRAGFLDAGVTRPAGGQLPPGILDDRHVEPAADAAGQRRWTQIRP